MIIYAFRAKSIKKAALLIFAGIICIAITIALIYNLQDISVFATASRDLPIYYVDSREKTAAITFDCAWGDSDIPQILDTLKKENVYATFFIVGQWAEKYPNTVKMIADAGHDVANHGYSHLRMGALDPGKISSEITLCSQKLEQISGKKVDLFRPPYGDYSNNVVATARKLNHHTIQWNVDSLDWKPGISQQEILNRVMNKIKPGAIILFHNDTPHTAKILPTIISTLKNNGYSLQPVSNLIMRENYRIDFDGKQKSKE